MDLKQKLGFGLVAAVGLAVGGNASAAVLTVFSTADLDNTANTSDSPDAVAADISSGDLTLGPGLTGQTGWNQTLDAAGFFGNASLATAIANDDYATITITPDAGQEIDFSNFHVILGINVGTETGDNSIALLSSATGFTAADALDVYEPVTATGGALANTAFDTNLAGVAALQNVTGAVEFRLYYSQVGNRIGIGAPFSGAVQDDLRIDGTVTTVPEPGSLALLGLGGLMAMRRKRG